MACTRHPHRRRSDCPDCYPKEVVVTPIGGSSKPPRKGSASAKLAEIAKAEEKTSREMLAELDAMEKEADEIVIKKERKRVVKEITEPKVEEVEPTPAMKDSVEILYETFAKTVNGIKNEALFAAKNELEKFSKIRFEHLAVPMKSFRHTMIAKLEKEGWGYKDMFAGKLAEASGYKEDVVLFQRVANSSWPAKPVFKKEEDFQKYL